MLIVLSIVLILCGLVFLLSAIIMGSNIKRTRTPRGRKTLIRRCRNTWALTVLFLAGGVTLLVLSVLPMGRRKATAGNLGYNLASTYKTSLDAAGEEKAYLYLPSSVYIADGKPAVKNERSEWFVYEQTENSEGEVSFDWLNRGKDTVRYQTASLAGEQKLTLQLTLDGRLYADGSFPYMTYDNHSAQYEDLLEKDIADFFCSGNALFYRTADNTLYAFGFNEYGQLGDNSNRNKSTPVEIKKDIVSLSSSQTHTVMVDNFGNLYATGDNSDSQLGDGTMTDENAPIRIMSGIKEAAAGNFFTVILAQNGEIYTCGRNTFGQCGNGTKNGTAKPLKIGEGAIKVVASANGAAYLTEKGAVYAWGKNTERCFVKDDTAYLGTPTLVAEDVYDIAIEEGTLVLLTRERDVKASGKFSDGKTLFTTLLDMGAKVPEEYQSPVLKEEKPDISELGK